MEHNSRYKVIIAHSISAERRRIETELKKLDRFSVVLSTDNGFACMKAVEEHKPDLVILGAVLSDMDGLSLLGCICAQREEGGKPRCLFLTSFKGYVERHAAILGADYCMVAPYIFKNVAERALQILLIQNVPGHIDRKPDIERETWRVLTELNVPPRMCGFGDAMVGVPLLLEDWNRIHNVTGELYPAMGNHRSATWQAVERGLRTMIRRIWTKASLEAVSKYFGEYRSHEEPPTSSLFMAVLAEQVARRINYPIGNRGGHVKKPTDKKKSEDEMSADL